MNVVVVGELKFDPDAGRLTRDGVDVPLGGRALAVLTALTSSEETVTKEALLDSAWPGVTVEEGNLTVQIATLRKLLGEDAIVTVPRVGYRLRREIPLPPAAGLPRIAVLPFTALGGGPEDGYFAAGIVEDIITALGRFREFTVLSRRAAEAQADRLPEFGVAYVLEGSVRRAGDRLRVSARLTATGDGSQLWARNHDGKMGDIFDVQDRITEAVVGALVPEVQAAEYRALRARPRSTEGYDYYLRALAEADFGEASTRRGYDLMQKALEAEPDNPVYLAAQAWFLQQRAMATWPQITDDDGGTCAALARRALALGTDDPRALSYCANALLHSSMDFGLALATGRRALRENPNMMWIVGIAGCNELHAGDLGHADMLAQRALTLSPADPVRYVYQTLRAHVAIVEGRHEAALTHCAEALAVLSSYAPTHWIRTAALAHLGREAAARDACDQLLEAIPGTTLSGIARGQPKRWPERISPILDGLRQAGLPED